MAYEKQTWQTGDVITQEKLNHMEDGIANSAGYECSEEPITLVDQTMTSTSDSTPVTLPFFIDAEPLYITVDGTDYVITPTDASGGNKNAYVYGNYGSFTNYPFYIYTTTWESDANFYFKDNGEHTVNAHKVTTTTTTTDCFVNAVVEARKANPEILIIDLTKNAAEGYQKIQEYENTGVPVMGKYVGGTVRLAELKGFNNNKYTFLYVDIQGTWMGVTTYNLAADGTVTRETVSYTLTQASN